jgi:hypothetical protein
MEWKVPVEEITAAKGVLSHKASERHAPFGQFARKAATLLVPWTVTVKEIAPFTLIGTRVPRIDTRAKIDGTAQYAFDLKRPGMLTALIARPPRFGSQVKSVDDGAAKAVPASSRSFGGPRRRGARQRFLAGQKGPRRAADRVGRCRRRDARHRRTIGRLWQTSGAGRIAGPQGPATPTRRSQAPPKFSPPTTNFPIWRMRRWSR